MEQTHSIWQMNIHSVSMDEVDVSLVLGFVFMKSGVSGRAGLYHAPGNNVGSSSILLFRIPISCSQISHCMKSNGCSRLAG